jgi:hypothetical protein
MVGQCRQSGLLTLLLCAYAVGDSWQVDAAGGCRVRDLVHQMYLTIDVVLVAAISSRLLYSSFAGAAASTAAGAAATGGAEACCC